MTDEATSVDDMEGPTYYGTSTEGGSGEQPHTGTEAPGTGGTIGILLRQFCETSSMRSVPRIVRAPTVVQRLLWVFALLVGVAMTSNQLFHLLGMYLSYRTSINMVQLPVPAPFPDVTVCNLNPLWTARSSPLNRTLTYEDYLQRLQELFSGGRHIPATKQYLLHSLQTYEGYLQYFSEEDLDQVQDHLVWGCRWEYREGVPPRDCGEGMTRHVSPYYGPCSTLRLPPAAPHAGQPSRLSMLLFVNDFAQGEIQDFFLSSYFTYSSGVRLLVHPPGTFPLMDEGVNLPPGHESTIAVRCTERRLMGAPYDSCVQVGHINTSHARQESYTYTKRVCTKFCLQDYIISRCGCVDPYTPYPRAYRGLRTRFCGLLDFSRRASINETLAQLECLAEQDLDGVCDCPQPCRHHLYNIEVSQVPWPHINYHMAFYRKYVAKSAFARQFRVYSHIERDLKTNKKHAFVRLRKTDLIARNFLEVSVMLDGEQTTVMEDYPVLSLEGLFGNMGGILNLWVGITFVTAVEVMDLVWTCMSVKQGRSLIRGGKM